MFAGDYVECLVDTYASVRRGERRRIQKIEGDFIVLKNHLSSYGTSTYRPSNFRRVSQHAKEHKETPMLHIAVRINDMSIGDIHAYISEYGMRVYDSNSAVGTPIPMVVDTSAQSLKNKVAERIKVRPEERWLILSANTIGEISTPPVVFRGV